MWRDISTGRRWVGEFSGREVGSLSSVRWRRRQCQLYVGAGRTCVACRHCWHSDVSPCWYSERCVITRAMGELGAQGQPEVLSNNPARRTICARCAPAWKKSILNAFLQAACGECTLHLGRRVSPWPWYDVIFLIYMYWRPQTASLVLYT